MRIRKIVNRLTLPFRLLRARISYDRAVRMAQQNLDNTAQRTYVIAGAGRRLLITDRSIFRRMKQKGLISKKASVKDLEQHCFYCTPYMNGNDAMPPEVIEIKKKQAVRYLCGLPYRVFSR